MSDAIALATATLMDMVGRAKQLQAAIIRGAPAEEIERLRQEGVAVAEAYFDRTAEAAKATRALIAHLPDADELGAAGARRLLD